jgi:iron-sulfur cluster repair protein YtfE (RIC family)
MAIPESLNEEHTHLRDVLERAVREEGALGEAAKAVMEVLKYHFEKEEQLALPPLGMLALSGDGSTGDVDEMIDLTGRFSEELPRMLEEHVIIAERLEVLSLEAERSGNAEYTAFARDLMHHAQLEEEIMYPASLLVGAYLRLWKASRDKS